MRSLLTSRLFRCVVCLLLICCVLIQISPLKVRATSAVVPIVKAATVTGNPYVIVGAALIALGVMVGTETGAFETVVDNAVSFLDTAGGWIENGTMQLLQTVDSTGQAMYYAAGDLLETLRGWIFDFAVVSSSGIYPGGSSFSFNGSTYTSTGGAFQTYICSSDYISASGYAEMILVFSSEPVAFTKNGVSSFSLSKDSFGNFYWTNLQGNFYDSVPTGLVSLDYYGRRNYVVNHVLPSGTGEFVTDYDISLGVLHSTALDGDTYDDAYAEYMRKQLRVINSGGDGGSGEDPDNGGGNNWKWYLPLALAGTAAATYGTTQLQQWTGVSMNDYQVTGEIKEFEILDTPEVNGYQGIEIQPVQDPAPGTGGDSGETPDPTTGGDPGSDPDTGGSSNPDAGQDPDTNPDADPDTNPDTNPDSGGEIDPGTGSNREPSNFFLDLRNYFPFCIPFDIFAFLSALVAPPEAPVFRWELRDLAGNVYELEVDLSPWDPHAALFRDAELLLFIIGLALITKSLIQW